ncbi:ADP-ribosylglycohydrolase family protein [Frankia sp. CNm7]|uniref:ADP-ribosylglycohydrolase family protein n=1 Tax=Frankia nepalensis TaxID=1836974 RepID=A0A937RIX9_9ACTN|nr:ADP-ribosylglycohydrolase family protein [Frankia nepalensis]MBL7495543.1 ADP-ribosylglycohydrolase family protein [Frankia nepalensis]MBL7509824.1 ADP-ribosylglycohydrolase family protein [Frankia nepalensis]MBL7517511.1 ADP-ribosylglycohydrolase family protein [Frankia nepalensis]MBL7626816.1 ADP-ribosylglycohydrolase family protein [Frankia nepalensis]
MTARGRDGDDAGGTGRPPAGPAIAGALTAYACGDAFGLPWEGSAPGAAEPDRAIEIPARARWPRGGTSDDTALTLLVAEHLIACGGAGDPADLLRTLAGRAESIFGLGPSTVAAIRHFQRSGQLPAEGGRTNGAAMRALPAGWATPADAAELRRRWVVTLSSATHPSPDAQAAACVVAACASWAIEGVDGRALLAVALAEASALRKAGMNASLEELIRAIDQGAWTPPTTGVSLDPLETVGAVLHCVSATSTLESAMLTAVGLGGDTDTVAALVGGILARGRTSDQICAELTWNRHVLLPPPDSVRTLADGLAELRARPLPT